MLKKTADILSSMLKTLPQNFLQYGFRIQFYIGTDTWQGFYVAITFLRRGQGLYNIQSNSVWTKPKKRDFDAW